MMRTSIGDFTGRDDAIAAFHRQLNGRPPAHRVLVYWGLPGQGKSTLLRRLADEKDLPRHAFLDLENLGTDRDVDSAVALLEALAQVFLDWAPWPHQRRRFHRARRRADKVMAPVTTVQARIDASKTSCISNSTVHIDAHRDGTAQPVHSYRSALVNDICRLSKSLRRRRAVLFIDTSERLRLLDEVSVERDTGDGGRASVQAWFGGQVLPRLLASAPGLCVVLAGREPLPIDAAEHVEITDWPPEESRSYLRSCGLNDTQLARAIHAQCRGVPVWTAMVAEMIISAIDADQRVTSAWLGEIARGRPAEDWLPNEFMTRLTTSHREVVRAAAVLRTITKEMIEALLAERELPNEWYERLCRHSFVRVSHSASGRFERRFHPLVRSAVLSHLGNEEPAYLKQLHQRAATYFAGRPGAFLEEAYHRFAAGDDSLATAWEGAFETAQAEFDTDQILRLASVVIAPENINKLLRGCPHVIFVAALGSGVIANNQKRFADARTLLSLAVRAARLAKDPNDEAAALHALGLLCRAIGQYYEAKQHLELASQIYRRQDDASREAHLILELAIIPPIFNGNQPKARSLLRYAQRQLHSLQDLCEGTAFLRLAELESSRPDALRRSEQAFEKAAAVFREMGNTTALTQALRAHADMLARTPHRSADALLLFRQIADLAREHHDHQTEAVALADLGSLEQDPEVAKPFLHRALALSKATGTRRVEAFALGVLGKIAAAGGRPTEAEKLYRQALAVSGDAPDNRTRVLLGLIRITRSANRVADFAELSQEALRLARAGTDRDLEGSIIAELAHSKERTDPQQAISLFDQSLELTGARNDPAWMANAASHQGGLLTKNGDWDKAERRYRQASKLYRALQDSAGEASVLHQLGNIALAKGHDSKANGLFERALKLYNSTRDAQSAHALAIGHITQNLAALALIAKRTDKAIHLYQKALTKLLDVGDAHCARPTFFVLSQLGYGENRPEAVRQLNRLVQLTKARKGHLPAATTWLWGRLVLRMATNGGPIPSVTATIDADLRLRGRRRERGLRGLRATLSAATAIFNEATPSRSGQSKH